MIFDIITYLGLGFLGIGILFHIEELVLNGYFKEEEED